MALLLIDIQQIVQLYHKFRNQPIQKQSNQSLKLF